MNSDLLPAFPSHREPTNARRIPAGVALHREQTPSRHAPRGPGGFVNTGNSMTASPTISFIPEKATIMQANSIGPKQLPSAGHSERRFLPKRHLCRRHLASSTARPATTAPAFDWTHGTSHLPSADPRGKLRPSTHARAPRTSSATAPSVRPYPPGDRHPETLLRDDIGQATPADLFSCPYAPSPGAEQRPRVTKKENPSIPNGPF